MADNVRVLKPSGRTGLTTDENWYRLQQHVLTEMLLLGEALNDLFAKHGVAEMAESDP